MKRLVLRGTLTATALDAKLDTGEAWERAGSTLEKVTVRSNDDWLELVDIWVASPDPGVAQNQPTLKSLQVRTDGDFFGTNNPWHVEQSIGLKDLRERRVMIPPKTTVTIEAGNILLYRRISP